MTDVKTCLNFDVKIMIFIKNAIFVFITVTSSDNFFFKLSKNVYIRYVFSIYLLRGHIEIPKKSFREGGRGQSEEETGLCGGRVNKSPSKGIT